MNQNKAIKKEKNCATVPCSRSLCSRSQNLTDSSELHRLEMEKDNLHLVPPLPRGSSFPEVVCCALLPEHIALICAEHHGMSSPVAKVCK